MCKVAHTVSTCRSMYIENGLFGFTAWDRFELKPRKSDVCLGRINKQKISFLHFWHSS